MVLRQARLARPSAVSVKRPSLASHVKRKGVYTSATLKLGGNKQHYDEATPHVRQPDRADPLADFEGLYHSARARDRYWSAPLWVNGSNELNRPRAGFQGKKAHADLANGPGPQALSWNRLRDRLFPYVPRFPYRSISAMRSCVNAYLSRACFGRGSLVTSGAVAMARALV